MDCHHQLPHHSSTHPSCDHACLCGCVPLLPLPPPYTAPHTPTPVLAAAGAGLLLRLLVELDAP
jgi:hypothetical protein